MTINVEQNSDGTLKITWDENDPREKELNNWTEEDFLNAIKNGLEKLSLQNS